MPAQIPLLRWILGEAGKFVQEAETIPLVPAKYRRVAKRGAKKLGNPAMGDWLELLVFSVIPMQAAGP
ncbi:hypothetical protein [Glutamicibacter sp. Je.9.36]|uniref:hypothetical protein n=1 Tax=Glutamicibacter sp. Je.9.36 TaxID=3142837 RepID=UPI003DA9BA47